MNVWIFFALGLFHGINPGMGWLLGVSVGIQNKSRRSLLLALVTLTFGHAVSVGAVIFGIEWLKLHIPFGLIQFITIVFLLSIGIYHLFRHWHPKWMALNAGYGMIFVWSFLIATAHGAGLMLIPFLLKGTQNGFLLLGLHTLGYILASFGAAFLLFETARYAELKRIWINFDLVWASSLIITALFLWQMS